MAPIKTRYGQDCQGLISPTWGETDIFGRAKNPIVANGLKTLRDLRGWTLEQAGEAMGLSASGYKKIEKGERKLSQAYIIKARAAFGASTEEVTGDAAIQPPAAVRAPEAQSAPGVEVRAILVPLLRGLAQEFGLEPGLARELASAVVGAAYNPSVLRSPPAEADLIETGRSLAQIFGAPVRR